MLYRYFSPQGSRQDDEWKCSKHADFFCSSQLSFPFPFKEIRTHLKVQCMHVSHKSLVMKRPEGTIKVLEPRYLDIGALNCSDYEWRAQIREINVAF
ncbi:hypothetical protein CDAR_288791 [Caerostris darwini]|uniref:Uncharacterized protein n=1 Tax=Caerostris darwini TaxID=1538125 RepID=A0AAV4PJ80_9ARAC|nr:hypothetical protein CDAR_288791 [Caerostris darwini]